MTCSDLKEYHLLKENLKCTPVTLNIRAVYTKLGGNTGKVPIGKEERVLRQRVAYFRQVLV